MTPARAVEVDERVARLRSSRGNGASATPSTDDLDWVLFHSFPGSEVEPARLIELIPLYADSLSRGAVFDFELLFVRVLELGASIPDETRIGLARAAAGRALAGRFDPADAIAAVRFVIRALPNSEDFLEQMATGADAARLRFDLTVDFLLDERDLGDYLALSYLREGDPDAEPVLARFPVPESARTRLAAFFEESACRRRVQEGWPSWVEEAERATLLEALRALWPNFTPVERG
jgi:hypothetical protein